MVCVIISRVICVVLEVVSYLIFIPYKNLIQTKEYLPTCGKSSATLALSEWRWEKQA